MSKNYEYLLSSFELMLKNKSKIKEALCCLVLPRYEDFSKDFKILKHYKKFKNIEECLAFVFEIELEKMKDIIRKLDIYKNAKNTISQCMAEKNS